MRGGRQIYIPSMVNINSVQVEIELTALLNIVFWGLSWHRILGRAVCPGYDFDWSPASQNVQPKSILIAAEGSSV